MIDPPIAVLVVEDGHEYTSNFTRFLGSSYRFERAGTGAEALALLPGDFRLAFLDMRFDRVPPQALLGDLAETANRFNGDVDKARAHLESNQGTYILAAIRAAGFGLPVVLSYDFGDEPRRWANLARLYGPLSWLPDNLGPDGVRRILEAAVSQGGP